MLLKFLKSLVHVQNPYHFFPHWAVNLWVSWIVVTLGTFAIYETLGLKRWHNAVPLTWVIRDMVPHLALLAFGVFWIVHFVFGSNPAAK